jgi:enterochelin esterase family protein
MTAVTAFDALRARVSASPVEHQQALVDTFVAEHPHSPLVGDDEAIIFYTGAGQQVLVRGDMLGEETAVLERLKATKLWFHRGWYERDARLDYHLLVDGEDLGDPRNLSRVPGGYGPRAEIRMPQYHEPELWRERPDVARGTLHAHAAFESKLYPSTRTVWVYTPPGYASTTRYSSVYFHDGGDYLRFGNATAIFDNLLADGAIPPCIAVFVEPSVEHGRTVDYDLNLQYARLISDELVPFIDSRYSTHREPNRRAVVGASFGGLIALLIAHQRPDLFGLVASQSGFASRADGAIIARYGHVRPLPVRVHLIIGTYETHIGPLERDSLEANFLRGNRGLRDVLVQRGYLHAYAEYHEGHSWGLWRARLGDALCWLLAHTAHEHSD